MPRRQQRIGGPGWIVVLLIAWSLGVSASIGRAETVVAATAARIRPLITDMPAAGGLAAVASGQTVYIIDESTGAVVGCDPFAPEKRWPVMPAPERPGDGPVALGCIDSTTLAAVSRSENGWALRSYRLGPPGDDPRGLAPRSTRSLGPATDADSPQVTVGLSREWVAVTGFAAPRGRIHFFELDGAQPVPVLKRDSPQQQAIVAAAGLPGDLLAVFDAESPRATARLTISPNMQPRPLLTLDTGLPGVRAAAASRTTGELWVLAGAAGAAATPEGLWRIEATLHDGRQAVRAVCVAKLDAPRSLVWISDRMLLVVHGMSKRTVSHVDPSTPAPSGALSP